MKFHIIDYRKTIIFNIFIIFLITIETLPYSLNNNDQAISWQKINSYAENVLMNPLEGTVIDSRNYLYLYDAKGDYPLYMINLEDGDIREFGSWGRGPGEMSYDGEKRISVSDKFIYVYDLGMSRITVYNLDGTYHNTITPPPGIFRGALYFINDENIIFISHTNVRDDNSVATGYEVDETGEISTSGINYGLYEEHRDLIPKKNNALVKQGPVTVSKDDHFYIANYYSSIVMGFMLNGDVLFKTYEPDNVPLPRVSQQREGGRMVYKAPDVAEYPQRAISLAVDDQYLYLVYSGNEITRWQIVRSLLGANLRLFEGKMLYVYDRYTGTFKYSAKLPVWTVSIAVDDDHIYLTTWEKNPRVIKYLKPEIHRK